MLVAQLRSRCAGPAIDSPPGLALSAEESGLLQALFCSYSRLVIENEFLSGYSGARTFLVRPIRPDGCADALTIVKLGPRAAIRQEFENYEAFVKDSLPPMTARIQRPPVMLSAPADKPGYRSRCGPVHLYRRARAAAGQPAPGPAARQPDPGLLLRLFETFGPNWWMQRRPYTFRLGQEYDSLLPPHYVLEPLDEVPARGLHNHRSEMTSDPAGLEPEPGHVMRVQPFRQVRAAR